VLLHSNQELQEAHDYRDIRNDVEMEVWGRGITTEQPKFVGGLIHCEFPGKRSDVAL